MASKDKLREMKNCKANTAVNNITAKPWYVRHMIQF